MYAGVAAAAADPASKTVCLVAIAVASVVGVATVAGGIGFAAVTLLGEGEDANSSTKETEVTSDKKNDILLEADSGKKCPPELFS